MDIRRWLENTADRASPDGSDDPAAGDRLVRHGDLSLPTLGARRDRRKRKRASSDSSIITSRHHGTRHAPASLRTASPGTGGRQRSPHVRSRGSFPRRGSQPESDTRQLRKYERRQRRKPRPDRYETKPKKERKEPRRRDDKERKRRKSNRIHDGSRTTGLVQSFQVKNGPKHSRLTLRADANTGLFKHGRASAQAGGKSSGLPDLAFNELRFLQRPNEHQDTPVEAQDVQNAKKDERRRHRDGDISAYFAAQRRDVQAEGQFRRKASHSAREVVDLPEKPSLGFGNRRLQADSRKTLSDATTVLSWSESVPQLSPHDHVHRKELSVWVDLTQSARSDRHLPSKQHATDPDGLQHRNGRAERDAEGDEHGGRLQSRRVKGSKLIEVHESPVASRSTHRRMTTPLIRATSELLPRYPVVELDRPQQSKMDDLGHQNEDYNTYRTSDILKVTTPDQRRARAPNPGRYPARDALNSDKENQDPSSPLSVDKILSRLCHTATIPFGEERPDRKAASRNSLEAHSAITYQAKAVDKHKDQQLRQAAILKQMQCEQQARNAERGQVYYKEPAVAPPRSRVEIPQLRSLPEKGVALARDRSRGPLQLFLPTCQFAMPDTVSRLSPVLLRGPGRADTPEPYMANSFFRSKMSILPDTLEAQIPYLEHGQIIQSEDLPFELSEDASRGGLFDPSHHSIEHGARESQGGGEGPVGFWKPQQLY